MKKFLTAILGAAVIAVSALGFTACANKDNGGISVYMPDGAPALAMAQLMSLEADFGKDVNYHVVSAEEIASHVTYNDESKNADICVLPVNDASSLLGDGARYKLLGTVTHGNLYFVSAPDKTAITPDNFKTELAGKKVGVVQIAKFPGDVTKLLLKGVNVTLQGVTPQEVGLTSDCDYFVMPEPAASTKVNAAGLKFAGSLQELYEDGNGYPQAVLVAKNSLIKSNPEFVAKFTKSLVWSAKWLLSKQVSATDIFNAIKSHYPDPEGTDPSFKVAQLTEDVITNCSVYFQAAADCKTAVQAFLTKLGATPASDEFFYNN